MTNKFNRIGATITGAAMLLSSFVSAMPASAATTDISDTLSREKINEASVTHSIVFTTTDTDFPEDGVLTFGFVAAGFAGGVGAITATGGTGTVTGSYSSNDLVLTCTTADCGGTWTVTGMTATNPGSAGSKTVLVDGTLGASDFSFAVPITTEDQITVTATVNPFITFQVQASATTCDHGGDVIGDHSDFATNGGTVAFGVLSPGAISSSDAGGVNHICTFVSTNAASGYALTVKSNGGLSNGSQWINDNSSGEAADAVDGPQALVAGTEGYGMCLSSAVAPNMDDTLPLGDNLVGDGDFDQPANCASGDNDVAQLTSNTQTIGHNEGPVQEGTAQWLVKAAIAATTGAGSYSDTLTFIATGTF